jgi:hypothetical protein
MNPKSAGLLKVCVLKKGRQHLLAGPGHLQTQTNANRMKLGDGNWCGHPGGGSSPVNVPINSVSPPVFFRRHSQQDLAAFVIASRLRRSRNVLTMWQGSGNIAQTIVLVLPDSSGGGNRNAFQHTSTKSRMVCAR